MSFMNGKTNNRTNSLTCLSMDELEVVLLLVARKGRKKIKKTAEMIFLSCKWDSLNTHRVSSLKQIYLLPFSETTLNSWNTTIFGNPIVVEWMEQHGKHSRKKKLSSRIKRQIIRKEELRRRGEQESKYVYLNNLTFAVSGLKNCFLHFSLSSVCFIFFEKNIIYNFSWRIEESPLALHTAEKVGTCVDQMMSSSQSRRRWKAPERKFEILPVSLPPVINKPIILNTTKTKKTQRFTFHFTRNLENSKSVIFSMK